MKPVAPGGTIGILGGGQLGRMLALEARRLGYRVGVLDPSEHGPAAQVSDFSIQGAFADHEAALNLARKADVVTFETELIPSPVLEAIESITRCRPSSTVLRLIHDRETQRRFLERHGIPQPQFASITQPDSFASQAGLVGFPAILKTSRSGYDGKGQARVATQNELADAWKRLRQVPAVLEAEIPFTKELSAILARSETGNIQHYPIAENVHRRHILHTTRVPAHIDQSVQDRAQDIAAAIAEALNYCGLMAVEFFLLGTDTLLVNEVAPRPHNSGHFTFGACATSQFEQHVRAICGLPLGDPALLSPAVMVNLLGDLWHAGHPPDWAPVWNHPQAHLHLYGKAAPAPGRKMGHILLLHPDTETALTMADRIIADLSLQHEASGSSLSTPPSPSAMPRNSSPSATTASPSS